ncbi:uncharacterized protein LOC117136909 [Drosophila mauritiana]|uniref:Uncharacterized protein LOC117136909 n=1 Tax=Drosophila mauritiana TaxID=7226 RepID=A0A6P8JD08_DROMA|nr:uncharacterized protein LOC117136909 [Drosophila mauritiana]
MKRMENPSEITEEQPPTTHDYQPRLNEVAQKFLADLDEERQRLSAEFPLCALLIDEARDHVYGTGRIPGKELYANVSHEQLRELMEMDPESAKHYKGLNLEAYRSFSDTTFGGNSDLIKRVVENPPEVADMDELDYDYDEHRMPPIHLPMGYEYSIPRPSLIVPKFKRSYPYSTDFKPVPEPPIKSYKPNPGIDTYVMKSILGAQ